MGIKIRLVEDEYIHLGKNMFIPLKSIVLLQIIIYIIYITVIMTLTDDQLAIVFEEAGLNWNKISHTLTKDTCPKINNITQENVADVFWCLAKTPKDKNAKYINLLNKFISDNADVIQNNEESFKRRTEGLIRKLGLPDETVDNVLETFNDIVNESKKRGWNSSTKLDGSNTYRGGLAPIAIAVIVIAGALCAMVWFQKGGKPKRKTRKNRNRKPKKSQKKRKSRKNRKSNHNKR